MTRTLTTMQPAALTGFYQGASLWHIQVQVKPECGIWIGTAAGCAEDGSVIKAERYGQTAESVQIAVTELLHETIINHEKR